MLFVYIIADIDIIYVSSRASADACTCTETPMKFLSCVFFSISGSCLLFSRFIRLLSTSTETPMTSHSPRPLHPTPAPATPTHLLLPFTLLVSLHLANPAASSSAPLLLSPPRLFSLPAPRPPPLATQVDIFRKGYWPRTGGLVPESRGAGQAGRPGTGADAAGVSGADQCETQASSSSSSYSSSSSSAAPDQGYLANGGADAALYPLFGQAVAYEAVVHAGEMLYIPSYWFHHISSLEETVSLTFWFKCGPANQVNPKP